MNWICSVILMVLSSVAGFFAGSFVDNDSAVGAVGFAILFAVIAGFACVIYTLEHGKSDKDDKPKD